MKKLKVVNFLSALFLLSLNILYPVSTFATDLNDSELRKFSENSIFFFPTDTNNYCTSGGDCYITGETDDERLWSALRHVGFTPEQAAGVIGNIVHEGGTPTRQEQSYITARDRGCLTQEGQEYDIYLDSTDGQHHAACMEAIQPVYYAGRGVSGIGLGFIQWTSHSRRLGYLEKMEELGLLKYFEGDAYDRYGRGMSNDELKEIIIEDTGSDQDFWALWCAAIKFIYSEMQESYPGFFDQVTTEEYAGFTAEYYEACYSCDVGDPGYNSRVATALEYYQRYKNGEFNSVESGSAPSSTSSSSSSKTTNNQGDNVLIIGGQLINETQTEIASAFPNIAIDLYNPQSFATNTTPFVLLTLNKYKNDLRNIIIIETGENSKMTSENIKQIIDVTGPNRSVFFLTHSVEENTEFITATALYDNLKLIDWSSLLKTAPGNPTDYINNSTLTEAGKKLLTDSISNAIQSIKPSDTCKTELVFYYQEDEPWGSMDYGQCPNKETVASSGCGPTSLAMIVTALTGKRVTPDNFLNPNYFICGSGARWGISKLAENFSTREYGLTSEYYGNLSIQEVSDYLRKGVMFHVAGSGNNPFTEIGHFIGIRGITPSGKWLIFDSYHKDSDNNTREWDPSEIYPYVHSGWYGVKRENKTKGAQ